MTHHVDKKSDENLPPGDKTTSIPKHLFAEACDGKFLLIKSTSNKKSCKTNLKNLPKSLRRNANEAKGRRNIDLDYFLIHQEST